MDEMYSIYVHVPFCRTRCAYCDFNTYAGQEARIPAYVTALCREAQRVAGLAGERLPVHTVFFGGGTPSLLPAGELERIVKTLENAYSFQNEMEITLEANPGTVNREYLSDLRSLGINRLSYGMQSASPEELRLLGRTHDFGGVVEAVKNARLAGFERLSVDLIYGLPGQPLESWQHTLDLAVGLGLEHISCYSLTIEEGTPFGHWAARGLLTMPDDDTAGAMYEEAMDRLAAAGYEQYEISNWARRDTEGVLRVSRHNLQYWRNLPYLGLGAGAHGYAGGVRTANVLGISEYIRRVTEGGGGPFPVGPALAEATPVSTRDAMEETMMVGLRLTQEGVSRAAFVERFGVPVEAVFGAKIARLTRLGLLEAGETLRLTRRGRLVGNQVFMEFVGGD